MTGLTPHGLTRRSLGAPSLWVFGVTASSPMTVVAGAMVGAYATTGVLGLPLGYLALTAVLLLFAVGYIAQSRYVAHTATFYAFLARGLGPTTAVAGGAVALIAYNAIQICLYGLFGATAATAFGGPWWAWAGAVWLVVGVLGVLHIQFSARVLAVISLGQLAVILLFDVAAFTEPAGGTINATPLLPSELLHTGLGGAFTFVIASFMGVESVLVYREEADSQRSAGLATMTAFLVLGVLYAATSWAMAVAVGPANIAEVAADPDSGLPFSVLAERFGALLGGAGLMLLLLGILACMIGFHNVVARYVYALAREGILPGRLDVRASAIRDGVPTAGSVAQSTIAASTIAVFAVLGADPVAGMFTWLGALAALGILALMIGACGAAVASSTSGTTTLERVAPILSGVALIATMVVTTVNLDSMVGSSPLRWLLPSLLMAGALIGIGWARQVRRTRPGAYAAIGQGQPQPLAVVDHALADVEL